MEEESSEDLFVQKPPPKKAPVIDLVEDDDDHAPEVINISSDSPEQSFDEEKAQRLVAKYLKKDKWNSSDELEDADESDEPEEAPHRGPKRRLFDSSSSSSSPPAKRTRPDEIQPAAVEKNVSSDEVEDDSSNSSDEEDSESLDKERLVIQADEEERESSDEAIQSDEEDEERRAARMVQENRARAVVRKQFTKTPTRTVIEMMNDLATAVLQPGDEKKELFQQLLEEYVRLEDGATRNGVPFIQEGDASRTVGIELKQHIERFQASQFWKNAQVVAADLQREYALIQCALIGSNAALDVTKSLQLMGVDAPVKTQYTLRGRKTTRSTVAMTFPEEIAADAVQYGFLAAFPTYTIVSTKKYVPPRSRDQTYTIQSTADWRSNGLERMRVMVVNVGISGREKYEFNGAGISQARNVLAKEEISKYVSLSDTNVFTFTLKSKLDKMHIRVTTTHVLRNTDVRLKRVYSMYFNVAGHLIMEDRVRLVNPPGVKDHLPRNVDFESLRSNTSLQLLKTVLNHYVPSEGHIINMPPDELHATIDTLNWETLEDFKATPYFKAISEKELMKFVTSIGYRRTIMPSPVDLRTSGFVFAAFWQAYTNAPKPMDRVRPVLNLYAHLLLVVLQCAHKEHFRCQAPGCKKPVALVDEEHEQAFCKTHGAD